MDSSEESSAESSTNSSSNNNPFNFAFEDMEPEISNFYGQQKELETKTLFYSHNLNKYILRFIENKKVVETNINIIKSSGDKLYLTFEGNQFLQNKSFNLNNLVNINRSIVVNLQYFNQVVLSQHFQNLVKLNLQNCKVDLSQLCLQLQNFYLNRCQLENRASKNLIVEQLEIIQCNITISQLKEAVITDLTLIEHSNNNEICFPKYNFSQVYDQFPDVSTLSLHPWSDNIFNRLKTFSTPKISKINIMTYSQIHFPFRFFTNIKLICISQHSRFIIPQHLKQYREQKAIYDQKINNDTAKLSTLNEINIKIQQQRGLLIQLFNTITCNLYQLKKDLE
ncbi:Hypothetical_protein [Hexamita inflata]|uniref:Hypothetical_protein n=1 Tax=Hexamita inflata TaxID=28002 RepID=A0AA86PGQ4_9EUKA|nr:Hypothetical protein HINF_LOCUS23275 [Hexamita inflata]CAI9976889.1 Hypothetical protein HINF_LOCUS64534 [Hexamita inflata]